MSFCISMNGLQDITFFVIGTYSGRYLGISVKPEVDWFYRSLAVMRSYGKNLVTIGRTVRELLQFSFSVLIFGRHLGFWSKPEVDCFLGFPVPARSSCKNLIMIGQTVSEILRF